MQSDLTLHFRPLKKRNRQTMDFVEYEFMESLRDKVSGLKEVYSSEECEAMLFFCPIVSRAGTDIDAAMKHLPQNPSLTVPIIMVILHSTFDPERIIPDSNNAIQGENIFAVDCLIFDNRLLRCQKNDNAIVKTAQHFKSKKLTSYYCLNYHGDRKSITFQRAARERIRESENKFCVIL